MGDQIAQLLGVASTDGATPELAVSGKKLMDLMLQAKLLPAAVRIEGMLAPSPLATLPP
jgi:NitT/TauT family transport system substrate-binding protein